MPYRVTVRLNTRTGEFEIFQVDALETDQPPARHNADHEEAATALGRLVERRPAVEEVAGADFGSPTIPQYLPSTEQEAQRDRVTEQQEGA
jgi:hypothetical protein